MGAVDRYLEAARGIPRGETRAFAELAALAGRPGAARAAGRALAACPSDAGAPWHRVVAADGSLARDAARARLQLRRLVREGARPRAGEPVARWAARVGAPLVGRLPRRELRERDDPRAARWPRLAVEPLRSEEAARARGFRRPGEARPAPPRPRPPARRGRAARRPLAERLAAVDRERVRARLRRAGLATLPALLAPAECADLLADAARPDRFDRSVDMAPRGFGTGAYHYLKEPLAPVAQELRAALYRLLAPLAEEALGARLPPTLAGFRRRCRARGQWRPSCIVLGYGAGGVNHPHRDEYGPVAFPFQALVCLSRRGRDFDGGTFYLLEERPGGDRRHRAAVDLGDVVLFSTRMRHGMEPVTRGERFGLGVVFHLAR